MAEINGQDVYKNPPDRRGLPMQTRQPASNGLTPEEQAELVALQSQMQQPARSIATPSRQPSDLYYPKNIQVLSPDEEAEFMALQSQLGNRPDYNQTPDVGIGEKVINGVNAVGSFIDSYTGAPVRKGVNTLIDTGNPVQAAADFGSQIGANPDLAPVSKEIMQKLGVSDEIGKVYTNPKTGMTSRTTKSDADITGFMGDVALDWTNALPFVPVAKLGGKVAKLFKGSAAAAEATSEANKIVNSSTKFSNIAPVTSKEAKLSLVKAFRPDVAVDFKKIQETAKANGIPENLLNKTHEFGEHSIPARHEKGVAEGPLGSELMARHDKLNHAVSDAVDGKLKKIGSFDELPDHEQVGTFLKQSFDDSVETILNGTAETYDNALKLAPEMRLNKSSFNALMNDLNRYENWARKRLQNTDNFDEIIDGAKTTERQKVKATEGAIDILDSDFQAITKEEISQAKEVLRAVSAAKVAVQRTGGSAKQVRTIMTGMGKIAFKTKNSVAALPSDIRKFQELYFSSQKALNETIGSSLGKEFSEQLIENNKTLSKLISNRGLIGPELQSLGGAEAFKKLVLSGKDEHLRALKEVLSPEAWEKIRSSFVNNFIARDSNGMVLYTSTRKTFNKLKRDGKLQKFMAIQEINDLDDLLLLGERGGKPVLSTSGTGGSNAFRDMWSTVKNQLEGQAIVDLQVNTARKRAALRPANSTKRGNLVEIPNSAPSGNASGMQRLKDKAPSTSSIYQGSQAIRAQSNNDRSQRIQKLKQLRGFQ